MCRPISMILTKKKVIRFPGVESHDDILALAGIKDESPEPSFVKVELLPPDSKETANWLDWDKWNVHWDQDRFPDWFVPETGAKRVMDWAKKLAVVVTGECGPVTGPIDLYAGSGASLVGRGVYVAYCAPSAEIEYAGSAEIEHAGFAKIEYAESAKIEYAGSAEIKHAGFAKIEHAGFAKIEYAESAKIEYAGFAEIEYAGFAKIEHAGSAKIEHAGSAKIEHAGSAKIKHAGSAEIKHAGFAEIKHAGFAEIEGVEHRAGKPGKRN